MAPKAKALILGKHGDDSLELIVLMTRLGYDIKVMEDKEAALDELWFGEHRDIVFLDVDDVPAVAWNLVQMRIPALTVGVVADVNALESCSEKYLDAGVDSILHKPYNQNHIKSLLHQHGLLNKDVPEPDSPDIPKSHGARGNKKSSTSPRSLNLGKQVEQGDRIAREALILTDGDADHLLSALLHKHNFEKVMTMCDFEEALNQFWQGKHYDVVFLDTDNGPKIVKYLEEMAVQTLIIGIINNEDDLGIVGDKFRAAGVKYIFSKPLSTDGIETVLIMQGIVPEPDIVEHSYLQDSLVQNISSHNVVQDILLPQAVPVPITQDLRKMIEPLHLRSRGPGAPNTEVADPADSTRAGTRRQCKRAVIVANNQQDGYLRVLQGLGYEASMELVVENAVDLHIRQPVDIFILDIADGPEVASLLFDIGKPTIIGIADNPDAQQKYKESRVPMDQVLLKSEVPQKLENVVTELAGIPGTRSKKQREAALIVADNKLVDYVRLLEKLGYDTTKVSGLSDAVMQYRGHQFRFVLLDLQDGPVVARLLLERPARERGSLSAVTTIIAVLPDSDASGIMAEEYGRAGVPKELHINRSQVEPLLEHVLRTLGERNNIMEKDVETWLSP